MTEKVTIDFENIEIVVDSDKISRAAEEIHYVANPDIDNTVPDEPDEINLSQWLSSLPDIYHQDPPPLSEFICLFCGTDDCAIICGRTHVSVNLPDDFDPSCLPKSDLETQSDSKRDEWAESEALEGLAVCSDCAPDLAEELEDYMEQNVDELLGEAL